MEHRHPYSPYSEVTAEHGRHYDGSQKLRRQQLREDLCAAIGELHRQYMAAQSDLQRDVEYILRSTALLMAGCCPPGYQKKRLPVIIVKNKQF